MPDRARLALAALAPAIAGTVLLAPAPAAAADATGPMSCWACSMVLHSLNIIQGTTENFPALLANRLWPLVVVFGSISILWNIGKAAVSGLPPLSHAVQAGVRLIVLSAIMVAPANIGQITSYYAVGPALNAGAWLGAEISKATAVAGGVSIPASDCGTETPEQVGITNPDYIEASNSLMVVVCQVQAVTMVTYQIGAIIASQQLRSGIGDDLRLSLFYSAIGVMMMYTAFSMLLDFALTLFETILRLGIFLTFVPILAAFWVYPTLRGSAYRALTNVLFVFTYLALSGLGATVTVTLMMLGMRLGLGVQYGPIQTPAEIIMAFSSMITTGATVNDSMTLAAAVRFIGYTTICTTLAMGMQRGVHRVSMEITNYRGNAQGDRSMAIAAKGSINSVAGMALSGAAGAGGSIARVASGFAGRLGMFGAR